MLSCDPMEETYEELESQLGEPAKVAELELELTDDDYAFLAGNFGVAGFGNFESEDEARQYIPYVLDDLFPYVANRSSAMVTYNLYRGRPDEVVPYTSADSYSLTAEDYYSVSEAAGDAGFFNNDTRAGDYIPGILNSQVQDAEDGEIRDVSYEFAGVAYADISGVTVFAEDFETQADFDQYVTVNVTGDQVWQFDATYGTKMSGYAGGNQVNEDWMILPQIDLSGHAGAVLNIRQAINYLGSGHAGVDLAVKISTDYSGGDITAATWENLEVNNWPAGTSWTFVDSDADLSAYESETISIAFVYKSTADFAATWEVRNVSIEVGETIETTTRNVFYEYNASEDAWGIVRDDVIYLAPEDYDAMGEPGRYYNFSSSVSPDNYLPQFLKMKFPYAQEEDQKIVIYKYFSSGEVQTRGDLYTFTNGEWRLFETEIEQSLQFGKENGVWVPDNTIKYTLTPQDYSVIAENPDLGSESARSNLGNFGNFYISGSYWSTEEVMEAIDYILHRNFPDSEEGQKFFVTYDTYPAGLQQVLLILNSEGVYEVVPE
jgi:hypothetical protein